MKTLARTLSVILFSFCVFGSANASIVNINARNNAANNPISIFFEAGTYDIIPISIDDGGLYTAWSTHYGNVNSWIHKYSLSSNELCAITIGGIGPGPYYANANAAFEHAISTSFTLQNAEAVNFYVYDGPNGYGYAGDNVGGVSLEINAVPIPGSLVLLLSGILGLFGFKKRGKSSKFAPRN